MLFYFFQIKFWRGRVSLSILFSHFSLSIPFFSVRPNFLCQIPIFSVSPIFLCPLSVEWPSTLAQKTVHYRTVPSTFTQMTVQFVTRPSTFEWTVYFVLDSDKPQSWQRKLRFSFFSLSILFFSVNPNFLCQFPIFSVIPNFHCQSSPFFSVNFINWINQIKIT